MEIAQSEKTCQAEFAEVAGGGRETDFCIKLKINNGINNNLIMYG